MKQGFRLLTGINERQFAIENVFTPIDPRWSHEGLQVLPILWEIMANWICFDSQAIVALNLYMKPCSEDSFRHSFCDELRICTDDLFDVAI